MENYNQPNSESFIKYFDDQNIMDNIKQALTHYQNVQETTLEDNLKAEIEKDLITHKKQGVINAIWEYTLKDSGSSREDEMDENYCNCMEEILKLTNLSI